MNRTDRIKQLYGKGKAAPSQPTTYEDREAYLKGKTIHIKFPKSMTVVETVKRIHDRHCIGSGSFQHWTAPLTLDAIQKLREAKFDICDEILRWENNIFSPPVLKADFQVPGLLHPLLPYQLDGVQMLEYFMKRCGGSLLSDDQGLGKTGEALAWLHMHPELRPVLIICPANLKLNWLTEIKFWLPKPRVQVVSGLSDVDIWGDFVIVNYDILSRIENGKDVIRKDIWRVHWEALLVDEAHYISDNGAVKYDEETGCSNETIRTWAVKQIRNQVDYYIAITATPGKHRPLNLFTIINMVDHRIFPSFFKYAHRYCGPKKTPWGWDFKGSSNEGELHELLKSTMMIRRTKQEVFKDLPRKRRVVIPFEIDNRAEYRRAAGEFDSWQRSGKDKGATFKKIEELKQLAVRGKMKAAVEWIRDMLETEDKLVIFAEHKLTINWLMKEFGDIAVRVDGSTSHKKREEAKHAFQRCARCDVRKEKHDYEKHACKEYVPDLKTRIYIGSSAAREGNTLTASEHVIFMELWWSPKDHDQAEDRCYGRAGDLHGATAWYLIADETIEIPIAKVYDLKNISLEKMMDGRDLPKDRMLTELLYEYNQERRLTA